jgi:UDP-N-acetyl-D-glucosamine dehydrogenase
LGADLRYHDPYVPELAEHGLRSEPLDDVLEDADLLLIVTAHPGVDHDGAVERVPLALDLRGVTRRKGGGRAVLL